MNAKLVVLALTAMGLISGCDLWVSSNTRIQRATTEIAKGEYERAVIELRNVLQSEADNAAARIKLIEALLLQSNVAAADAEAQLLRKQTVAPEAAAARADMLARVMLVKRDFVGLLAAIQSGEMPLAESIRQLREAQALLGLGKAAEARDKLQSFLKQYPDNDEAHIYYAQLLAATGQDGPALQEIDAVLKRSPSYANAWVAKGVWQTMHTSSFDAVQSFVQAAEHAAGQLTRAEETALISLLIDGLLSQGRVQDAEQRQQRLMVLAPGAPVTQLVAARIAIAKEDYTAAIGILQKLVSAQPDFTTAQVLLGGALAAQGNLRQAEAELEKLIAKDGINLDGRKVLAEVNLRLAQNARAIEVLAPVVSMAPTDGQLSALATRAQMATANSPDDLVRLLASQKREPANESLRLLTAGTLLYARKPGQAFALLRDASENQLDLRRVPVLLSALAADKGIPAARVEAERIGATYANDVRYLATIGLFFAGNRDYATARGWFDRALAKVRAKAAASAADNSGDGATTTSDKDVIAQRVGELGLLKLLGTVDVHLGNRAAALAGIQAYRQAHPDDLQAIMIEGDILLELQDFPGAASAYEIVVSKAPSQSAVIALYRARRFARLTTANAPLENWLLGHESDVAVRMLLAESYQASGDAGRAITEFEKIVALQPVNAAALNNLAVLYQTKGDKRAEPLALQAYKRAEKSPEVADTYGWILLQNGKVSDAAKILAAAAAGAPNQPDIQFHNAVALSKTGDVAGARKRLQELLAKYPKFSSRAEAEKALTEMGD